MPRSPKSVGVEYSAAQKTAETKRKRNAYKALWGRTKGRASRLRAGQKWRASPSGQSRAAEYRARHAEHLKTEAEKRAKRRGRGQPEPTRPAPHRCECCGLSDLIFKKGLFLDHDHTTRKFRGWLCDNCNLGIGRLNDNLEGVKKAVAYLEKFG